MRKYKVTYKHRLLSNKPLGWYIGEFPVEASSEEEAAIKTKKHIQQREGTIREIVIEKVEKL